MEPIITQEPIPVVPLLDKDSYYKDSEFVSFSDVKLFSECETLFRDMKITKVYEEGDKDYFTYGKLVDALLTEDNEFISQNFARVERKIKIEDALKYENKVKELQNYINEPSFKEKIEKGNKTAIKGLEKRQAEIASLEETLNIIAGLATRIQVTYSIWDEAHDTALSIKTHPCFSNFEWNHLTSQQIFTGVIGNVPRKGRLDHLKLSPAITKIYSIYIANKITKDEMREHIKSLNPNDWWAIITDIKTCYDMAKLEPFNDHYTGQLSSYQSLVSDFFGIPCENIKLRILVGDKVSNSFKKSELFEYDYNSILARRPELDTLYLKVYEAKKNNKFVSEKEKKGMKQACFKCTECRFCPFSMKPGEPVLVAGPRFAKTNGIDLTKESYDLATGTF